MQVLVVKDITERQPVPETVEISESVQRKQSHTLLQLAMSKTFQQGYLNAMLNEITQAASETLLVDRVGVWLYNQDGSVIDCIDLYDATQQSHTSGQSLAKVNYPVYFQTLEQERTIAICDAIKDERTKELSTNYLSAFGIVSLLDAPIWVRGRLVGIVCHEHCGQLRQWTAEEENFAGSIADFISLALETRKGNTVEEALCKTESQFRAIFERSSIGIGLVNMAAQIVDANPVLCRILGYSKEELCGKPFTNYICQQRRDIERYQQIINEIHANINKNSEKTLIELERRFLHQNGSLVWTKLSISVIPNSHGEPEYFLAIVDDITDRKQTEMKLRNSQAAAEAGNRAKSEFLATMSHELRTPLNAIMGLSQLLQQEIAGSLNERQREYINCIYTSGENLLSLINDILDLSKVEAGKEELCLMPLLVVDICNDLLSTICDRALAKGLKVTQQIDPDANYCIADEQRIKQMLFNLLTNAIKFTPQGEISLIVKKVPEGITFTVADTGIGIDSNHFQFLFEPFKQLDSRLNRQYEGTGLGLALTQKLARLHGGDVTVTSTLGVGSEFTLFLPDEDT